MVRRTAPSPSPSQKAAGFVLIPGGSRRGHELESPGVSSSTRILEAHHQDHENLLYLTDSEATLQVINRWIGGGAKLNLVRSSDGDVLKAIIIKLQKRVKAGVTTLLIKVKVHRGDPLNEEADIRAEIDRRKEEGEKVWDTQTDRTIFQWSEPSKTKEGTLITKTSTWRHSVRNRMRQKAGEIQAFRALERGVEKWCREHTQRHESSPISGEGQNLIDNTESRTDAVTKPQF